jgi:hypothetical protein
MLRTALAGCSQRPSNEAADAEAPETYVQRYVEEDSESRTTLGSFSAACHAADLVFHLRPRLRARGASGAGAQRVGTIGAGSQRHFADNVPAGFFEPRLDIPWQLKVGQQDIGCIQDGPLKIDVSRTWAAHSVLHSDWQQKIETEAALIRSAGPACVLSDISHLGIAAGAATGIPTIGLCSLSWDLVLEPFADPARREHATILRQIREAYAKADCFLRVAPALAITAFHPVREIGPIAEPAVPQPAALRKAIGAGQSERVVLVGFGGIALRAFPFEHMEAMDGFRFVVDGASQMD